MEGSREEGREGGKGRGDKRLEKVKNWMAERLKGWRSKSVG